MSEAISALDAELVISIVWSELSRQLSVSDQIF